MHPLNHLLRLRNEIADQRIGSLDDGQIVQSRIFRVNWKFRGHPSKLN
jgi:hypothetical protein